MYVKNRFKTALSASLIAISVSLGTIASGAAAQNADTPSVKVGRGELVSPSAARTYYAGVSNPGTTDAPAFGVEPEIKALAAALKNDPDLIFEYVHDKIEFVPLYGLQKGGLGTLIDKSGTAFDQAQLLVKLLRAAGHTANYVMGDLEVSKTEFEEWFGITNATAACHLLADGGIPATITGATATCTGLGSALPSSVIVSHVWVTGTENGGGTFNFDPSFKHHTILSNSFDLKTKMGYTAGAMLTTAGGTTSGNTAHSFNMSGINSSLDSLSSTLITAMTDNNTYDKSLDMLLGAELVKSLDELGATHTGVDGSYSSVGGTVAEIPNAYRTLVELDFSILDQATTSHVEFYADQLYGRRLAFDWKANDSSIDTPSLAGGRLTLDDAFVTIINTRVPGDTTNASLKIADGNATEVKFTVNHAYASSDGVTAGKYMDREYQRAVGGFSQSVTFVFGFAGASDAVVSKVTSEHYRDTHYTVQGICAIQGTLSQALDDVTLREVKLIEHLKTQVGYGWLAQFSRAVDLQARSVDAVAQHHHSFGMAYTSASWEDACSTAQNPEAPELFSMTGSALQIDMLSGISVNQRDGSEVERRATAQAMAIAGATLEGSVFEQYAGTAHTASTTERFEWFNENAATGQSFHILDDSDSATFTNALPNGEVLSGNAWFDRYTSEGYIIVAPEGAELGPGAFGGAFPHGGQSFERGSAFIAVKPDGSDIAHIVFTGLDTSKGGGASQDEEKDGAFDPSKVADALKDQFEDRSKQHGVDLASGQVSYSPPADITTGAGEFPYSLAFQRSYNTSGSRARGMGVGWTHNWDINASVSGSGAEAMGATRAVRAVPSLVAFTVMQDVFAGRTTDYAKDSDTLKRVLSANLVAHWWREHIQNNVVTVQQGANGIQFVKLPGEVFDAPTSSNAKLDYVGTGRRFLTAPPNDPCWENQPNIDEGRCTEQYIYSTVKYRYTSVDGDSILFNAGRDVLSRTNSNIPQFLPDEWTFASGVKIRFTHNSLGQTTNVRSNLGGGTGTFSGPALNFTWSGESMTAVTGTGLGSVTFVNSSVGLTQEGTISGQATPGFVLPTPKNNLVLASSTDLMGNTTSYKYTGNGLNAAAAPIGAVNDWMPRLYEVITPEYITASQRFAYDETWRINSFKDGEAVLGNRGAWAFHIAPGHRGERIAPTVNDEGGNPVNPAYVVAYDFRGRAVKVTDEGARVTTASYDDIDRVVERIFPSGVKSQFSYDTKSNVDGFTTVGSSGATKSVSADYGDSNWLNKVTLVTDALNNDTTITYYAPGTNGAGQPHVVTLPEVETGEANQYSYTYNSFGQPLSVTDPEGMIVTNTYGASSGFLASSAVDSAGLNLVTSFGYNAAGDQTLVDGPRTDVSDVTSTLYDGLRRPLEVTNPVGTKSKTIYDQNGRTIRTEARDASGTLLQVSGKSYIATGQDYETFSPECYVGTTLNTSLSQCAVTLTTYDGMDRPDVVTDPVGRKSKTVYFESGDVESVIRAFEVAGFQQDYQTYTYVPAGTAGTGQVATVADAKGNKTRYSYDQFDQLGKTEFPHKTSIGSVNNLDFESYIYDANNNQTFKKTRADDWIENQYDPLNRVKTKLVRRGSQTGTPENTVHYTYDLIGRDVLIRQLGGITNGSVAIPAHNIFYKYDSAGRLDYAEQGVTATADSSPLGFAISGGRKVDVGHNQASARDSLTFPAQGSTGSKTVAFTYDAAGRMDLVKEGTQNLANYAYDALSRKNALTYLNNAGSGYTYHADSAIKDIVQGFTGTAADVTYTFGYNKANQVTGRNISNISYVFNGFAEEGTTEYDSNGLNQYEETRAAPPPPEGQSVPAPETVVATSYEYDYDNAVGNGNLTSTGRWDYIYDAENRLVQAYDTLENNAIQFQYDGKGRRIKKAVDNNRSGSTFSADIVYEYLYEGDEPIQDYLKVSGSYVITHRYLHGAAVDERLVHWSYDQNTGAEVSERFYHRDHQGSIIAMSDAGGNRPAGELYTYDAYGNMVTGTTSGQPFRYTGRRWDDETGLYYYRARYYSAELGRFLQTDPIGYEDNMNLYGYVGNDPINLTDPTGENGVANAARTCAASPACAATAVTSGAVIAAAMVANGATRRAQMGRSLIPISIAPPPPQSVPTATDSVSQNQNASDQSSSRTSATAATQTRTRRQDAFSVRIQLQGKLVTDNSIVLNGSEPISLKQVHSALTGLAAAASSSDRALATPAFIRASIYATNVANAGGTGPQGSKSSNVPGVSGNDVRVDIEIQSGDPNIVHK